MHPATLYSLVFVLCADPIGASTAPHTPVEQWTAPRLYHTPFDDRFEDRIRIGRSAWPSVPLQHRYSPNKAYWFGTTPPDTSRDGPWDTSIFIDNETGTPLRIDLLGHASYPVDIHWINEKLLYLQVWWGRMIGAYLIYDVELELVLVKEMIRDGGILFRQHQQFNESQSTPQPARP